jgi:hypothetical protein
LFTPPITWPAEALASVKEELAELGVSGQRADRPDLDAGLVYRQQHQRQSRVLGRGRVGTRQDEDPVRRVAGRLPRLLPVDHPFVAA